MTQGIIMAAGASTRLYPLTATRPKPLIRIMNKTLMEYNLDALHPVVDEFIIIVGYMKEQIIDMFKGEYRGKKIVYVEQKEFLGTGHALLQAESAAKGDIIVFYGDDIHFLEDMQSLMKHRHSLLGFRMDDVSKFGALVVENGVLKRIVEKPKEFVSDICNIGAYHLDQEVFPILKALKPSPRGEYELTDALSALAEKGKVAVELCKKPWIPIGYPWHVLEANEFFIRKLEENDIIGSIEDNTTIKGPIILGKDSIIKAGSYVEGPVVIGDHCTIGPNSYIRPGTTIGNGCHIGAAVEIKNSVIFDNAKIPHLCYLGDSVIGENVNLSAGTVVANLRHDGKNVKTMVKDELVDSGRRKLGTIIGDNVKTGINTSILPGRKIWPGLTTYPGEVVKVDKTT